MPVFYLTFGSISGLLFLSGTIKNIFFPLSDGLFWLALGFCLLTLLLLAYEQISECFIDPRT